MYEELMNRSEMMGNLEKLNEILRYNGDTLSLVLGGATNVILPEIRLRLSGDMDTLTDIRIYKKYENNFEKYKINCDMIPIALVPTGYERRVNKFKSYSNLDIYLLDPYDFIVSKIATRRKKSQQDIDDVIAMIDHLEKEHGYATFDFEYLKELALEALSHSSVNEEIVRDNFNYLAYRYFSDTRI